MPGGKLTKTQVRVLVEALRDMVLQRRRQVAERMIEANGVELCTESFGDPADPPILLVMGIGASMLWWEEGFCRMLADGGRFVIRYDHRDTGRSVDLRAGAPGYTGADLVADAAGVLDAYGIAAAHMVGVSAGGAFAQLLALDFPDRVLSLVLISTSPAHAGRPRAPAADRGVRAVRLDGGGGLVRRRVGDRVPRRLLAHARGRRAPVRRGGGPGARPARRRARPQLRGACRTTTCSPTTSGPPRRCPRSPRPRW